MPTPNLLSDEEYRLLLEEAFDRHIRDRFYSKGRAAEEVPPERWLEAEIHELRQALLIADFLGQRRDSDLPDQMIFHPPALEHAETTLIRAFDRAKHDLEENGFVNALGDAWEPMLDGMKIEHLPEADFALLKQLGRSDPRRDMALTMALMKMRSFERTIWTAALDPTKVDTSRDMPRAYLDVAHTALHETRPAAAVVPPLRRRWWKGLSQIGTGSALAVFNCGLALSMFAFPISPADQTVGAITSAVTGLGMIAKGVGEFRQE
jgi:hypothetical protein